MKYFKIEYHNGYCGCDQEEYLTFDDLEEAEAYAEDGKDDYGQSYEHVASGWGQDFDSEEDRESYYENLTYTVEEVTQEEFLENGGTE